MKYLLAVLLMFVSLFTAAQKENSRADSLLSILVGEWKGKGESFGTSVEDSISFHKVLRSKFLFMNLTSIKGDEFIAEGYLWFNPTKNAIEFYEFNDGAWPVRILSGRTETNKIILEENTNGRHIRITFTISKNAFDLEEARIREKQMEIFVKETFTRVK